MQDVLNPVYQGGRLCLSPCHWRASERVSSTCHSLFLLVSLMPTTIFWGSMPQNSLLCQFQKSWLCLNCDFFFSLACFEANVQLSNCRRFSSFINIFFYHYFKRQHILNCRMWLSIQAEEAGFHSFGKKRTFCFPSICTLASPHHKTGKSLETQPGVSQLMAQQLLVQCQYFETLGLSQHSNSCIVVLLLLLKRFQWVLFRSSFQTLKHIFKMERDKIGVVRVCE